MCYQLQREAATLRHLPANERLVLGCLASHWNAQSKDDDVFPTEERIGRVVNISKSTVIRCLKKLGKEGYFKKTRSRGKGCKWSRNFYALAHDRIHNESLAYEWHFSNSNSDHAKKLECELKSSGFDYKSFLSVQIEEKPGVKMTPNSMDSDPEIERSGVKMTPNQVSKRHIKEVILKEESYQQDYINKEESKIFDFVKSEDNNPLGRNEHCVREKSHATH